MIPNLLIGALAAAVLAAGPPPSSTCTPVQPGDWAAMSVAGAPEVGDVADVKTRLLGGGKWWVWNAYSGLTTSAVFDARCNAWRPTAMAKGPPVQMSRQYGVLAGPGGAVVVFGPTSNQAFAAYALDPEALRWTDLTPPSPAFQAQPQLVHDDHRLVAWNPSSGEGALLAGGRWEPFTAAPPPLAGHGYDCSFLLGGGWYIANPKGVSRFDLAAKTWATVYQPKEPMPMPDLGACTASVSGGFAVATVKPLSGTGRLVYGLEGGKVFQIPWPEGGPDQAMVAAGGAAWSTLLRRYDRARGKWASPPLPSGAGAGTYITDFQGQARLVRGEQMYVWDGRRFGPPVPLVLGPKLDQPEPPSWLAYRDLSPELSVTWGVPEARRGNNCDNPFHPRARQPNMPICTPSAEVTYRTIHPGGFFFLRAP